MALIWPSLPPPPPQHTYPSPFVQHPTQMSCQVLFLATCRAFKSQPTVHICDISSNKPYCCSSNSYSEWNQTFFFTCSFLAFCKVTVKSIRPQSHVLEHGRCGFPKDLATIKTLKWFSMRTFYLLVSNHKQNVGMRHHLSYVTHPFLVIEFNSTRLSQHEKLMLTGSITISDYIGFMSLF